jgi:hypothetical protein
MASPSGKRTGGPILRFELEGFALLEAYPTCNNLFKEKGWYEYCEKITRYHVEVTRAFVRSFDGQNVEFKLLNYRLQRNRLLNLLDFLSREINSSINYH